MGCEDAAKKSVAHAAVPGSSIMAPETRASSDASGWHRSDGEKHIRSSPITTLARICTQSGKPC